MDRTERSVYRAWIQMKIYHVSRIEEDLYGDELLWYGLDVSMLPPGEPEEYNGRNGDYQSKLFLLRSIE